MNDTPLTTAPPWKRRNEARELLATSSNAAALDEDALPAAPVADAVAALPQPEAQPVASAEDTPLPPELLADSFINDNFDEVHKLAKKVVDDVVQMGWLITESKAHCIEKYGHGHWLPLLKSKGWREREAQNLINIYEMSKTANFADLQIPVSTLALLAAPSTPPEAVAAIIGRAESGEKISVKDVKDTIKDEKAKKTAAPTHKTDSKKSNPEKTVQPTDPWSRPYPSGSSKASLKETWEGSIKQACDVGVAAKNRLGDKAWKQYLDEIAEKDPKQAEVFQWLATHANPHV